MRSHLGAAINFQAGLLQRAPLFVRKFGFEWLWRIKEEPHLWRRYLQDGVVLLRLMLTSVLPLALGAFWRSPHRADEIELSISSGGPKSRQIVLSGCAVADGVASAIPVFRDAIVDGGELTVDISRLNAIDPRFFGFLLMVRKRLLERGGRLHLAGASPRIKRAFRLNRFGFLLDSHNSSAVTDWSRPALLKVAAKASASSGQL